MTCIVGMVGDKFAVMAADRQIVDGWIRHGSGAPKIVRKGLWLLGTTGPSRVNNAVKHSFTPPEWPYRVTEEWIVTKFVPPLIEAMTATQTAISEGWLGGKDSEQQGTVLCACPGAIFTVQADWAVDLWADPYAAIGTGQRYALAALYAITGIKDLVTMEDHIEAVQLAAESAVELDVYCGGQVDVLTVPGR